MTDLNVAFLLAMLRRPLRVLTNPLVEAWQRWDGRMTQRRLRRLGIAPMAGGANRSTALYVDARKALEKAKAANENPDLDEPTRKSQYDGFWSEYETLTAKADEEKEREDQLKAASQKYDAPPTADRDDREAVPGAADGNIKTLDPYDAKSGVQLANGRVVPYATKESEGYRRDMPASVQHPQIIRMLAPDMQREAALENRAFWKYIRHGLAAATSDKDDREAMRRLSSKVALQEGTDAEGGFLVPSDQVRLPIIEELGVRAGRMRAISSQFQTTRDSGDFPRTTDDVTWAAVAEEGAPAEANPTFAQSTFTIRKFGRINKISVELLEDAAMDIPSLLGRLFTRGLGRFEDQQAIEGDGTTEPLGLRTTGQGPGNIADSVGDYNASTNPDFNDVTKHYFDLPEQFRDNLTWKTTSSFLKHLVSITGAGIPRIVEFMGDPVRPVILGRPVVMFDGTGWDDAAAIAVNEEFGAVGDFSYYFFLTRVGMTIRRLDELYAGNDQVGFFARTRYDSFYVHEDAFRIMKAAAA